jgi:tetratricopeptide (TPR) repeat protein
VCAGFPALLPPGTILYNLEQIYFGSPWLQTTLLDHFLQYSVWDYNEDNLEQLKQMGVVNVQLLPIGYTAQLTRIPKQDNEDIDVLFYGSINDRRHHILSELEARGVKVHTTFTYGKERDDLIARSKIILNLHFYPAKVFEIVRVSYLLANQRFVISERGSQSADETAFGSGVVFAEYEDLVETCLEYLDRPQEREKIAKTGFELMVQRPQSEYLRLVLSESQILDRAAKPFVYQEDLYRKRQAEACLEHADYATAIDLYEQSLEVDPDCTQSYWNMGLAYLLSGETFSAQLCWASAISQAESGQEVRILELLQVLEAAHGRFQQDEAMAGQIQQAIAELILAPAGEP